MKKILGAFLLALLCGVSTPFVALCAAQTSIYKAPIVGPSMGTQRVALTYRATFDIPAPMSGEVVVTVPFPADDEVQKVEKYSFGSAMVPEKLLSVSLEREVEYGNRLLQVKVLDPAPGDELVFEYVIARKEKSNSLGIPIKTNTLVLPPEKPFMGYRGMPLDWKLQTFAIGIVKAEMTPDQKIEAIYRYSLSGVGLRWKQNEADKEFSTWQLQPGDSGEVNNLAASAAQAFDIPAKLEWGIPIPTGKNEGDITAPRIWANLYHPQRGWVPIDAFEGARNKLLADYYLGRVGSDRITFAVSGNSWVYPSAQNILEPRTQTTAKTPENVPMKLTISFKRLPASSPMVTEKNQSSGVE